MMGKRTEERKNLANLADELVTDIFETPDEDILEEVREDGGDPKKIADGMRASITPEEIVQRMAGGTLQTSGSLKRK